MDGNVKAGDAYTGNVSSLQYSGEATLTIDENGLIVSSMFSDFAVGYEEIQYIKPGDYTVEIGTEEETISCSRMGNSGDWLHGNLLKRYNSAVTSALLAKGDCVFETKGTISYNGFRTSGAIRVFQDCICLLPPDRQGRRFPFSFLCCMKKENYALSIRLITGESCILSMLGRDLEPLEKCIMESVRRVREQSGEMIGSICGELNMSQKTKASNLLTAKIATPLKMLAALPVLEKAITEKIRNSEMKDTWPILLELCHTEKVCVGIWELPEEEVERLKAELLEKMGEESAEGDGITGEVCAELTPEQEDTLHWMIWVAIPSVDERFAIVEAAFPNEATATYIYRIPDTWESFLPVLNRAMEAVDFNREVIMIPEDKLLDGSHPMEQMLVHRTPALMSLRKQFAGRIVHKSIEGWKKGLQKYLESSSV